MVADSASLRIYEIRSKKGRLEKTNHAGEFQNIK